MTKSKIWGRVSVLLLCAFAGVFASNVAAQSLASAKLSTLAPGIEVQVLSLARTGGGVVTLRFTLENPTDTKVDIVGGHLTAYDRSDVGKVSLVDYANKKRYVVMKDSDGGCVCSTADEYGAHEIQAGGRLEFWASFAAPPEDVTRITVLVPGAPPMQDVPISAQPEQQ